MLQPNGFDELVVARIEEFWDSTTPWQRSLWTIGTVSSVAEVLEAAEGVSRSLLSKASLQALQSEVARLAGADPAVGDTAARRALGQLLRGDLTAGRVNWHSLKQLLPSIQTDYLTRLASIVRSKERPGPERVARYVASYLLEIGFSAGYLHRWLRYRVKHRPEAMTLGDLLDEAEADLVRRPPEQYKVIVPVLAAPGISTYPEPPPEWKTGREISALIEETQGRREQLRHAGGLVIELTARDSFGAVERAAEMLGRWSARAELASGKKLITAGKAWIAGVPKVFDLASHRRRAEIGALEREHKIYAPFGGSELSERIDDALQLLQPMQEGPLASAIGGGWAAIEALLTSEHETRALAADRLAAIVACSFPRAELTTLSYIHMRVTDDELTKQISSAESNLARARLMADALEAGSTPAGSGVNDEAAAKRITNILASPRDGLAKVRSYAGGVFSRLYRQRNLTLHGGLVSGDGRRSTARVAAPLVAAGIDRIAHAWFVETTPPLELAARAQLNLELVGSGAGSHVTALLEKT